MGGVSSYRDFDVAVARQGDELEVRVLGSPAGETGAIRTPFPSDAALTAPVSPAAADRDETRDAGPTGTGSSTAASPARDREAGAALFAALFSGDVLTRYRESRRRALAADAGVRLVLRFSAGTDGLPWELLWDTEHRRFLGLDADTTIVRCTEMPARDPAPPITGPLRVLVAIATPAGTAPLDAAGEERLLRQRLEPVLAGGALELDVLRDATLDGIRRHLERGDVHVFHYIGHGSLLTDGSSALALTGPDGAVSPRRAEDLAALLGPERALRLAVLNSCHGSPGDADDPFAGAAPTLVKAGVPAVVAMRRSISDRAAVAFAAELYGALVEGARIEGAVARGRAALFSADGAVSQEWSTVALHLGSSLDADLTASPLPPLDDDVQFTVSRPTQLRATEWEPMLVFAHRAAPYERASGELVDPKAEVEQRIAGFFGEDLPDVTTKTDDASGALPRGAQLVVVPDLPDVECEPARAELTWTGDVSEVRFLLRAASHRIGSTVQGSVRIFCGPLVIAETAVEANVVGEGSGAGPAPRDQMPVERYRRIFPCFSPEDAELVAGVAAVAEALGDRYTADVIDARRSGAPDEWMLPLITDADVFQLFWSSHSMSSASCRRQWETALAAPKEGFVRPLYWEDPFPKADGLPPPPLAVMRFARIPGPAPATTTTDELWAGAPSARSAAPEPADGGHLEVAPAEARPPPVAAPSPAGPIVTPPPPPRRVDRARRASWWSAPAMAAIVAIAVAGVVATNQNASDDAAPIPQTTHSDAPPPPTTTGSTPTTSTAPPADRDDSGGWTAPVATGVAAFALALAAILALRRLRR